MIVVKHVDSIFGSLLPIRLSTFKLVYMYYRYGNLMCILIILKSYPINKMRFNMNIKIVILFLLNSIVHKFNCGVYKAIYVMKLTAIFFHL